VEVSHSFPAAASNYDSFAHGETVSDTTAAVAYPGNFLRVGVQQIQLRAEDIKKWDLGAVAP